MKLQRRDFLKAMGALAGAFSLKASKAEALGEVLAAGEGPKVIWLQGQGCTGCSVSFLNTITEMSIDELLLNVIDLEFHPNVMASAGSMASGRAEQIRQAGGYVLLVEGAVPIGEAGEYCHIWEGTTMVDAIGQFAPGAAAVLTVGTCAAYGGIPGADPNPTQALGVGDALDHLGVSRPTLINLPGCPAHPDWVVATVALLLSGGVPELDRAGRPEVFFADTIHQNCPNRGTKGRADFLSDGGCLSNLGCQGQQARADCPTRQWNAAGPGGTGVNWCIGAGSPCIGCTEPDFPDGMSPFYNR
jgi:hydrogenase small subunit